MRIAIQHFVSIDKSVKKQDVFAAKRTIASRKDTLSLSSAAVEQARLIERMGDVSAIRGELIQRVKEEIEAGTYRIDSRRLAEFILQEGVV